MRELFNLLDNNKDGKIDFEDWSFTIRDDSNFYKKFQILIVLSLFFYQKIIMDYKGKIKEAVRVHQELISNKNATPEIIDVPLVIRANELHDYFYSDVPSSIFHEYVNTVHEKTGHENWLCGQKGVDYKFA